MDIAAEKLKTLDISGIARVIANDWRPVHPWAVPYVAAMRQMCDVDDNYDADAGRGIILRFLGNAKSWRGPVARLVKAELKARLAAKGGAR